MHPDPGATDEDMYDDRAAPSGARVLLSPKRGREERPSRPSGRADTGGAPARRASWRGAAGWAVYFPEELETDSSCEGRSKAVDKLRVFFLSDAGQSYLAAVPANSFALPLNFLQLLHSSSPRAIRGISAAIAASPEDALACIGLAACRAAEEAYENAPGGNQDLPVSRENRLWPRVYGFSPITPLRSLRGNSVGKFVAIRGTVVRVSNIRQQVVCMNFECSKCAEQQTRTFTDYKYSAPVKCVADRCRSRSFNPLRHTAETVDWQKIRVQENQERSDDMSTREEGRMPRTIDAELFADLIDTCIPGDVVTVCGIVRVLTVEGGGGGGNNKAAKCLYYMYLEANSTTTSRNRTASAVASATEVGRHVEESETLAVHQVIREVIRETDPFGFLVHSAIPSIYGHEVVKAGMLLALFGGSPKERIGSIGNTDTVAIRRDIHCLVVGDPGLGKSQMLKAISSIAPRGVYVCGNTTTTAGLTVTVVREASGDFALEAGALVLGDRGVCCIDEFDKMGAEHGALLEAMEQQSVSVAKAGLLCNLSARTTVIAAANPVGGHYDRSQTVCENLKIALPLLSRFDLVFILVDKPDEERDRFISEHVMSMFGMRATERTTGRDWRVQTGRQNGPQQQQRSSNTQHAQPRPSQSVSGNDHLSPYLVPSIPERVALKTRLRQLRVSDPLPPSLFRQYVAYARAHVHPELSEGAKRVLQEFYLTLRKGAAEQSADTTPITTRQLESLIRLSEARARAVMRTVVTEEDAQDVIEIMRDSMLETLTDETGALDLGRSTGMSRSQDARKFVAALQAESVRCRSALFDKSTLRRVAESIGASGERFETLLETVNYQGFLMKKGGRMWELASSSFSLTPNARPSNRTQGSGASGRGSQSQRMRGDKQRRQRVSQDEHCGSGDDYSD